MHPTQYKAVGHAILPLLHLSPYMQKSMWVLCLRGDILEDAFTTFVAAPPLGLSGGIPHSLAWGFGTMSNTNLALPLYASLSLHRDWVHP